MKKKSSSFWEYRVIRFKDKDGSYFCRIHDVYYDKKDKIWSWGAEPEHPLGVQLEDLEKNLVYMFRALGKPVLEIKGKKLIKIKK